MTATALLSPPCSSRFRCVRLPSPLTLLLSPPTPTPTQGFHEEYERYLAESLEELMDDPSLADEIIEEMSNLPPQKQSKAASRLLTVAKHLQKSNIRTQADEQVRA